MTDPITVQKKPVRVQAMLLEENPWPVVNWINDNGGAAVALGYSEQGSILVDTLEGQMKANRSDWVIRGVKGEFYPCKPDIFVATYDLVDGPMSDD